MKILGTIDDSKMDSVWNLLSLNLDQLLILADQKSIPVQSRISRCIIIADIVASVSRYSKEPHLAFTVNSPDQLGRNLALEVGVDISKFPGYSNNRWTKIPQLTQIYFLFETRKWLRSQGISEEYLDEHCLLSAVATVIYERKLPTPELFWYQDQIVSNIFFCSLEDFRSWNFKDDTPGEYIWETQIFRPDTFLIFLFYQKVEDLLSLARSFPPHGIYFETKVGLMDYLNSCSDNNPKLERFYLDFFSKIHGDAYPGRRSLINRIYQLPRELQIIPSYIGGVSRSELLAIPPVWYEEQYFQILLSSNTLDEFLRSLNNEFTVLKNIDYIGNVTELDISNEIFARMIPDGSIQPKSRAELAEMIDSKLFRKISPQVLHSLTGWVEVYRFSDIHKIIKGNLKEEMFNLIRDVSVCSNPKDFHLESHKDFAISFGTFTNFVCYSPEDLFESFRVNSDFVAFRRPDKPNEAFTQDEIDSLLTLLNQVDPDWRDQYDDRIQPLVNLIEEGLAAEYPIDLESVAELLLNMTSRDRKQAEVIFRNFFEAGMFQRTWNGIDRYPLKYEDTLGSSLNQIEIKMTPCLNNIRESYDKLSEDGQGILRSLAVVDYIDGTFFRRVDPLVSFETQTREGNFCIGYGSRLMIYSGYFYLSALRIKIPNFDLSEFDPESTHR